MRTSHTVTLRRAAEASTTFALLLGVSVLAPMLGLPQLLTGVVVNAALLIACVELGPGAAISIGVLPSLFAVMSGALPAALAPLVPFIMVGNALLVLVFQALRSRSYWLGAVTAAAAKSGLLLGTVGLLVAATDLLPAPVVPVALTMMSWTQLATALAGGVVAYAVLKPTRRL
jgi:hypothetical protein